MDIQHEINESQKVASLLQAAEITTGSIASNLPSASEIENLLKQEKKARKQARKYKRTNLMLETLNNDEEERHVIHASTLISGGNTGKSYRDLDDKKRPSPRLQPVITQLPERGRSKEYLDRVNLADRVEQIDRTESAPYNLVMASQYPTTQTSQTLQVMNNRKTAESVNSFWSVDPTKHQNMAPSRRTDE